MHEMAVIEGVLKLVVEAGEASGAEKVLKIRARMGEYSDIVPVILREYLEIAARGTIAEGAALELTRVPATVRCRECGRTGGTDKRLACTFCGSRNIALVTGREFYVEDIEVQ